MDPELKDFFNQVKTEFARLHERLDSVDTRFDSVDTRFDSVDTRFDSVDARFNSIEAHLDSHDHDFVRLYDEIDRFRRGVAEQFEAQQKYMDRRFNDILEALDFRHGNHERRIRKLEDQVFGSN